SGLWFKQTLFPCHLIKPLFGPSARSSRIMNLTLASPTRSSLLSAWLDVVLALHHLRQSGCRQRTPRRPVFTSRFLPRNQRTAFSSPWIRWQLDKVSALTVELRPIELMPHAIDNGHGVKHHVLSAFAEKPPGKHSYLTIFLNDVLDFGDGRSIQRHA